MVSLPVLAMLGMLSVRLLHRRDSVLLGGTALGDSVQDSLLAPTASRRQSRVAKVMQGAYRGGRNIADRAIAIVGLLLLSPILALIAVSIRLDSPGPIFFRQRRVGKSGTTFSMVKFRTLHVDAPAFSLKLSERDPRITRVGGFLRRSGLDEAPQLWNVLRGEMALIGPRPEQAELIDLYEPWQRTRERVRPGITGWWQIHHRDGAPLHRNVDKDMYYIEHQGPWLDLLIVIATVRILVSALFPVSHAAPASSVSHADSLLDDTRGA